MALSSETKAERKEARSGDVTAAAAEEEEAPSSSATPLPPPAAAAAAPSTSAIASASAPASSAPLDEVDRILRVQHNAYAVLKLDRRAKVFVFLFNQEEKQNQKQRKKERINSPPLFPLFSPASSPK
jgi:hypothetical protein